MVSAENMSSSIQAPGRHFWGRFALGTRNLIPQKIDSCFEVALLTTGRVTCFFQGNFANEASKQKNAMQQSPGYQSADVIYF